MNLLRRFHDRALSAYTDADWTIQQRSKALLYSDLVVIIGAFLDGLVSSKWLGHSTPSLFSDIVIFIGLLFAVFTLARGRYITAVNISVLVSVVGITIARVLSTGKFSVDPSYDIIQYALDIIIILFLLILLAEKIWQIILAGGLGLAFFVGYVSALSPVFGVTVTPQALSVFLSGTIFVVMAGSLATFTFLLNRKAIETAHKESIAHEESERTVRAVLDSSVHFVGMISPDGTVLEANQSSLNFAGIRKQDVIGEKFWDTAWWKHSDEMRSLLIAKFEEAVKGKLVQFEATHRSATGEVRVIDFTLKPIIDDAGTVTALIPEGRDITENIEIQKALVESRLRYFTLFNVADDAIFILENGIFIDCNATTLRMFGVETRDILGQSPWKFSPPAQPDGKDSRKKAMEKIQAAQSGRVQRFNWKHRRLDGTFFDADVSLAKLDLSDDKSYVLAIVRDVTQKVLADKALRASEGQYRALIENLTNGIVVSRETKIIYANPAALKLAGVESPDRVLGHSIMEFISEEYHDFLLARQPLILQGAAAPVVEWKMKRIDGSTLDVEGFGIRISYGGEPALLSSFTDITDRKKADRALRESEEKFSKAFHTSPAPMSLSTLRELRYLDVSRAFVERSGYTREEAIGKTAEELDLFVNPSDLDRIRTVLIEKGEVRGLECAIRVKGGDLRTALIASAIIVLHEEPCVLTIVIDVTERKKAEQSLRESTEQLHLLAERLETIREEERKFISHEVHDELGQLLTALKMDLAYLKRSGREDEEVFEEKTKSMLSLTNSAIKTVQAISTKLRPGILDDLGLIAAVEWQAEDFQKRSGVKVRLNVPRHELAIDGDRSTVLFRILQEAMTNVARHSKANEVEVTLSSTSDELFLSVADNGVGITDEQLRNPRSIGLLGIRERLHPFKGTCTIQRRETGGTEVKVRLPRK